MKANEFLNEDGMAISSGGFAASVMPLGSVIRRQPKKKKKRVEEMDSQQPTGKLKADGTRSHSNYGVRDSDEPWTPTPVKLDIPMRRHMIKKLAWETDYDLSDLELLKDAELEKMYYERVPGAQERVDSLLGLAHDAMKPRSLKRTMESLDRAPVVEPTPEAPKVSAGRRLLDLLALEESKVVEFAPSDSGDSGEEDNLHKYARMWYNGDLETQQQVEQILDRMGWEIGELESEEGGAFVVQSGDENGNSYIGFSAEDLIESSLNEFAPGGGESGRWYTDDQMTDIVGDGWWQDLDISGDISKQEMVQEAQTWLDDNGYSVHVLNVKVNDDDCEWFIEGSFQNSRFAKKGVKETKQRLDAKCWDGYKKQGTKIKGDTRVNNCVPEAANAAQQAAIAIAKKKKKELNEAPIELDPSEPTNPMIYGHEKANPAKLDYRMLRAAGQFKDLASRVRTAQEVGDIRLWSSIIADFKELSMNVGQISHALEELEKTRRKGGVNSRGIPDLS